MKASGCRRNFPPPAFKNSNGPLARTTINPAGRIVDIYKQRAGGIVQIRRPTLP